MTRLLAAFVLAAALTACGAGDPDPCDGPNGSCQNVPPCGETSTGCG